MVTTNTTSSSCTSSSSSSSSSNTTSTSISSSSTLLSSISNIFNSIIKLIKQPNNNNSDTYNQIESLLANINLVDFIKYKDDYDNTCLHYLFKHIDKNKAKIIENLLRYIEKEDLYILDYHKCSCSYYLFNNIINEFKVNIIDKLIKKLYKGDKINDNLLIKKDNDNESLLNMLFKSINNEYQVSIIQNL